MSLHHLVPAFRALAVDDLPASLRPVSQITIGRRDALDPQFVSEIEAPWANVHLPPWLIGGIRWKHSLNCSYAEHLVLTHWK